MSQQLILEKVDSIARKEVFDFLETVFSREQQIPKELIPLAHEDQHWWCIKMNGKIIGSVAAWKINSEWHWGRLAVDSKQRGLGLGKQLAVGSLSQLFDMGIDEIVIDARDITVKLLESLGGKIVGPTETFYNHPITPMRITAPDFRKSIMD